MKPANPPGDLASRATIKIRLKNISQLFNSLDPSPFIEKDLDADAEAFIEGWAAETHHDARLRLVLHIETPVEDPAARDGIIDAIHNFFAYKAENTRRELRHLLAVGRVSLLIGLLFVAVCIAAAQGISGLWRGTIAEIVGQSLIIVGWVAMWRPLEIFLYDWWPIARRARLHRRLSNMPIDFATTRH